MANTYVVPVDFSKTSDAALDGSVLRLSLPPYHRAQQPFTYGPNVIG